MPAISELLNSAQQRFTQAKQFTQRIERILSPEHLTILPATHFAEGYRNELANAGYNATLILTYQQPSDQEQTFFTDILVLPKEGIPAHQHPEELVGDMEKFESHVLFSLARDPNIPSPTSSDVHVPLLHTFSRRKKSRYETGSLVFWYQTTDPRYASEQIRLIFPASREQAQTIENDARRVLGSAPNGGAFKKYQRDIATTTLPNVPSR